MDVRGEKDVASNTASRAIDSYETLGVVNQMRAMATPC